MQDYIEQEEKDRKYHLHKEAERAKRVRANIVNPKDPFDLVEKRNQFNNLSIPFKNNVDRNEEFIYKII